MKVEPKLKNILLYAIGMLSSQEEQSITGKRFFEVMSKYLISIGHYGDSPFMMCNYGSSEFAQAFSRIGSLHRNVYIVTRELKLENVLIEGNKIKELAINYNDTPIQVPENAMVISSAGYLERLNCQKTVKSQALIMTVIGKQCLLKEELSSFLVSPGLFANENPIRIY